MGRLGLAVLTLSCAGCLGRKCSATGETPEDLVVNRINASADKVKIVRVIATIAKAHDIAARHDFEALTKVKQPAP
ncbi:MAG: hypothetical protein COC12_12890 [Rhodobacteraceae bacterium]|nr:MAG: hypothetical protein COC12_12890 [Paracoccaceae bacterium]